MQQTQEIIEVLRFPFLLVTVVFCFAFFFSKAHIILKLLTAFCVAYGNALVFYNQELLAILGSSAMKVNLSVFMLAALISMLSIFRFLKAGLTIVCWLMITGIIGLTAFPSLTNYQLSNKDIFGKSFVDSYTAQKDQFAGFIQTVIRRE